MKDNTEILRSILDMFIRGLGFKNIGLDGHTFLLIKKNSRISRWVLVRMSMEEDKVTLISDSRVSVLADTLTSHEITRIIEKLAEYL